MNYKGSKCMVCGEIFKDGDDIVVCPECGTPYHRECYDKNGKCVNTALHETGESWEPDTAEAVTEKRICPRCRQENPEGALYCCRCGLPFNDPRSVAQARNDFRENMSTAPLQGNNGYSRDESGGDPFSAFSVNYSDPLCGFNPSEEYENNVKLAELGAYVDTNTHYYLPKFKFMKETERGIALNFTALFFPQFYFAYRKMPLMAFVSMLVLFITGIPQTLLSVSEMGVGGFLGEIAAMLDMKSSAFQMLLILCYAADSVFRIFASFNANKLYFRHCLKKIPIIKSRIPENITLAALHREGGTSPGLLIFFIGVYLAVRTVLMLEMRI